MDFHCGATVEPPVSANNCPMHAFVEPLWSHLADPDSATDDASTMTPDEEDIPDSQTSSQQPQQSYREKQYLDRIRSLERALEANEQKLQQPHVALMKIHKEYSFCGPL